MFKLSNISQNNSLDSINYFESGRSLLETLAVLAIMALIGAVGVKGFTVAMNRHRANELLNEANKRATVVASQALLGKEENIDDFPKIPGYDFKVLPPKNKKFSLTLTKDDEQHSPIDSGICEQMKALIGEDGIVKIAESCDNASGLTLTFNEDLSKGVDITSSDYDNNKSACESNTDYKYCEDAKTCILKIESCPVTEATCSTSYPGSSEDGIGNEAGKITVNGEEVTCRCPEGQEWSGDKCTLPPNCDSYTGTGLVDGITYTGGLAGFATDDTTECRCPTGKNWENNTCVQGKDYCTANDDCTNLSSALYTGNDTYCSVTGRWGEITGGVCEPKGDGSDLKEITLDDGTVVYPTLKTMNWWSAQNYCSAHGKSMASKEIFTNGDGGFFHSVGLAALATGFKSSDYTRGYYWLKEENSTRHAFHWAVTNRESPISYELKHYDDHKVMCY